MGRRRGPRLKHGLPRGGLGQLGWLPSLGSCAAALFLPVPFAVLACLLAFLSLLLIYLVHSATLLEQIGVRNQILAIDNEFFFHFMAVQGVLAFLLTAFVGPGLISPDLANGALPLYFCRPFSRAEYVLGKSSVLAILLSQITWIPGLILFGMQASLAGPGWAWDHLWMAWSLVISSLIWIAFLSLLAMALSAWVKWRVVAGALLCARCEVVVLEHIASHVDKTAERLQYRAPQQHVGHGPRDQQCGKHKPPATLQPLDKLLAAICIDMDPPQPPAFENDRTLEADACQAG